MTITNKPTDSYFRSLRRGKGLTLQEVANAAGFSSATNVYLFEIGVYVHYETKQKIIRAFSQLTGQSYALSDFAYAPEEQTTIVIHTASSLEGRRA